MHRGPLVGILTLCTGLAAGEPLAQTDRHGRIVALDLEGDPAPIRTDVRIPLAGWRRMATQSAARDVERAADDGTSTWTGILEPIEGRPYRYRQTLEERDGAVLLRYEVTALADVAIEGVYFWLDLPIALFGGGTCDLRLADATAASGTLPRDRPPSRHLLRARADRCLFAGDAGRPRLDLTLDPPSSVAVQDNREWQSATYSALVCFGARLARGESAALTVRLTLRGEPDRSTAHLTLDPGTVRYRLDGFGGNYCFGIESPVTQYTLEHLRVAWARSEMTLPEWEPRNDNESPEETDWAFLRQQDRPGTNLRREFLLDQQLTRRGIPFAKAVWHLPEWLYVNPRSDGKRPNRRRLNPDKWPELLECLGSYLLHAKRQYGAEPALFSFNEPSIGVRVLFTAEEHRDAVKRIGAHFEKLGLRTRMLLGDVTRPRDNHGYVEPAAADPEAMRHVGALGFHSWGGASPAQYAAWADLAERLGLPLLVSELGVDAFAWQGRAYESFAYALGEVRLYQDLLLHARPQGTMQWEFTSDYGLVREEGGRLVPTARFWFVKHFCNLTPPRAAALATSSDHPKVLFTAFRGDDGALTLHIANLGAERPAALTGLPRAVTRLRAVRTSATESFQELPPVTADGGALVAPLARQSLLTLTTRLTQ